MIFPPVILGGAARLDSAITLVDFLDDNASSFNFTGLNWGDVVLSPNKRSIVVTILMVTSRNISGTPTINGANATVIYNDVTPTVSGVAYRFVAFAADVPTGASGAVTFSISGGASGIYMAVFRTVNLDVSTETDSAIGAAANQATLSIDVPAGGGVVGQGFYAYSSGSTPTSANFANLTTLEFFDSNVGWTASAATFATAQTGLNVTYDPTPNTNLTRSHGFALAFARTY